MWTARHLGAELRRKHGYATPDDADESAAGLRRGLAYLALIVLYGADRTYLVHGLPLTAEQFAFDVTDSWWLSRDDRQIEEWAEIRRVREQLMLDALDVPRGERRDVLGFSARFIERHPELIREAEWALGCVGGCEAFSAEVRDATGDDESSRRSTECRLLVLGGPVGARSTRPDTCVFACARVGAAPVVTGTLRAMARLTTDQWVSLRAMWEADPRPGTGWLTAAGGGPWGVSSEAIRQRRAAEGWQKRPDARAGAGRRGGAERASAAGARCDFACLGEDAPPEAEPAAAIGAFTPAFPIARPEAPELDDDLRARVEALHRTDWLVARQVLDRAVRGADRIDGRLAKAVAETLARIQAGEREAYLMDLPIEYDALSDEQLAALAAGKRAVGPLPLRGAASARCTGRAGTDGRRRGSAGGPTASLPATPAGTAFGPEGS